MCESTKKGSKGRDRVKHRRKISYPSGPNMSLKSYMVTFNSNVCKSFRVDHSLEISRSDKGLMIFGENPLTRSSKRCEDVHVTFNKV